MNQAHESQKGKIRGKWFGGHKECLAEAAVVDTWLGMSTNPLEL